MTCVIVDYDSGNLRSAAKSFERMARETGDSIVVSSDPDVVAKADRIVLPGVGAFKDCRDGLGGYSGLFKAIEQRVIVEATPFLGICVGMQLMATLGREHGHETSGFDWVSGEVIKFIPDDPTLKIPHMGWNELTVGDHPVLAGIETGDHAYFVHSYHLRVRNPEQRLAHTAHGEMIAAVVGRGNMVGTQFHPEKSQQHGLQLLKNFAKM